MKRVLVAAGTSENKLKFAVNYIHQYFGDDSKEKIEVIGASIYEADLDKIAPDLIVAIGPHTFADKYPVVNGIPFITKMGMEECCDSIKEKLQTL